ncbi:hypothetical protein HYV85_01965 [Candidatus Woesearchaeota archaeon]|nr:hypothetical protein [Candidatus Woesearchaeota archaeon]
MKEKITEVEGRRIRELKSWSSYIIGQAPDVLVTHGPSVCAATIAYDSGSRTGILGHYMHPLLSRNFARMMKYIAGNLKPSELEVILTGVSPQNTLFEGGIATALPGLKNAEGGLEIESAVEDYVQLTRRFLLASFLKIGVNPESIRQLFPGPDVVTHVLADTSTGDVLLQQFDYSRARTVRDGKPIITKANVREYSQTITLLRT